MSLCPAVACSVLSRVFSRIVVQCQDPKLMMTCVLSVIFISVMLPPILALIAPLVGLYLFLALVFRRALRQVKRGLRASHFARRHPRWSARGQPHF